jgi:hypothetical protein
MGNSEPYPWSGTGPRLSHGEEITYKGLQNLFSIYPYKINDEFHYLYFKEKNCQKTIDLFVSNRSDPVQRTRTFNSGSGSDEPEKFQIRPGLDSLPCFALKDCMRIGLATGSTRGSPFKYLTISLFLRWHSHITRYKKVTMAVTN